MTHPVSVKWAVVMCICLVMTVGVAIVAARFLAPTLFQRWPF
jgi:hypothetical protein